MVEQRNFDALPTGLQVLIIDKAMERAEPLGLDVTLDTMSRRIAELLLDANEYPARFVQDAAWYNVAHELATAWSGAFNLPLSVVVGVIAVTSPQTSWTRNRQDAHTILQARQLFPIHEVSAPILADRLLDAQHLGGALLTQPRRIIEAAIGMIDSFTHVFHIGNGPKVRNFFWNIYEPDNARGVTVDTHMIRALLGLPDMASGGPEYKATLGCKAPQRKAAGYTDGLYPWFAEAIIRAARKARILPHQAQAAAWCQWRRQQGAWGGTVDRDPVYVPASGIRAALS